MGLAGRRKSGVNDEGEHQAVSQSEGGVMAVRGVSTRAIRPAPREAWVLWSLSVLFLLRVVGQVLVVFVGVTFLPPSPEWYSGLLPYPLLLPVQVVILILMARANSSVTLRRGFFTTPHPR